MSLPKLWAFLAIALPTLGALMASLSSVDLAYHLRAGAEILDNRAIPVIDTWTFTVAGAPWTDQQWGAQVILAAVYRVAGWTGLALLRATLVAIIVGCLFEIGRRRGLGMRRAALLALAAFLVAAVALGLRPQLLGMALFASVLLLVSDRQRHPGRLWVIPVLVMAWANVHGSFLLGPLVLGLAWLEDLQQRAGRPHRILLVAIVATLAAFVTPFGPAVWGYAVGLSTNPEVALRIEEWRPTALRDVSGLLYFGSVLAIVVLIARRARTAPWPTLAWLGTFFLIGAYAARGVAWWALAAVVAVAGLLADSAGKPDGPEPAATPLSRRLNAVIAGLAIVVAVGLLPVWRPIDPRLDAPAGVVSSAPPGITATLRDLALPGDRLFNPQEWGSWFEFALPDLPVAIDSRIELYPGEVWRDYDRVLAGMDGWEDRLTSWGVTIAVMASRDQAMADRLARLGWRSVYSDDDGSIALAPDR